MAELVATAIVHRHLETLDRLGIDYDLLTQESEILHLKFWDAAFDMLKKSGAIQLATAGKTAGCWVMQLPSDREAKEGQPETPDNTTRQTAKQTDENPPSKPKQKSSSDPMARSPTSEKTSPTTSGSSASSTAIFTTSVSTRIPTAMKPGSPQASAAKQAPRLSATPTKSST